MKSVFLFPIILSLLIIVPPMTDALESSPELTIIGNLLDGPSSEEEYMNFTVTLFASNNGAPLDITPYPITYPIATNDHRAQVDVDLDLMDDYYYIVDADDTVIANYQLVDIEYGQSHCIISGLTQDYRFPVSNGDNIVCTFDFQYTAPPTIISESSIK